MKLHFESQGKGQPLLILHGLFGSLDNWRSMALRLSTHFRVISADQRNHGHSPHSTEMNYVAMAEDVRELMDREHISNAAVLGHSMGGKTAMQLALRFPERVSRLVVVDIAPRAYMRRHDDILQGMLELRPEAHSSRKELEDALGQWVPELEVRRFLLKSLARDSHGVLRWKIGLQEIAADYPAVLRAVESEKPYPGPVLFVRGAESDYVSEKDVEESRRYFPRLAAVTIKGAGHWTHAEKPDDFFRVVSEFLGPHSK